MNVYFDTEFTGLHKDTTLISIGLVADNGRKFYAEFTDYDKSQCDDWIKTNVLDNLVLNTYQSRKLFEKEVKEFMVGRKCDVKPVLKSWFESFGEDIQLVSDVCHYDMVLLIDIFGSAFDVPKYICPVCHDINMDIANKICDGVHKCAFNISREYILKDNGVFIEGDKHNSLYDAKVIKEIYKLLH